MSISDKHRKILWAKSGNRCAFCRQKLVIDENEMDSESVVGEECHIAARSPQEGRRFDPAISIEQINSLDNLILLCATHHKMIDDQSETYTATVLKGIKLNHEKWVEEKLKSDETQVGPRIRRLAKNIPKELKLITSGKELFDLASNCDAHVHQYPQDLTEEETEFIGGFLQTLQDWVDVASDAEPLERMRIEKSLDNALKELLEKGFLVFGDIERQRLEGGVLPPSAWNIIHLSVLRLTDPKICKQENSI